MKSIKQTPIRLSADPKDEKGFHWRDGWNFCRQSDGSVHVVRDGMANIVIPPKEWASIVCAVSEDGETNARWNAAQDFHGRDLQKSPV